MKYFLSILFVLFVTPGVMYAYDAVAVDQSSPFEISHVQDVTTEQWFAGTFDDFPHTFEFVLVEPTTINAQVMYPADISGIEKVSVIIIKEVERGVTEVMRRSAGKVDWTEFTDPVSGLRFYESPMYNDRLDAGVYRIEVSNPENIGRYVLKLGYEDGNEGYFNTLKDIKTLRNALGFNTIGMITNTYVFVPLFLILTVLFFLWFWYQQKQLRVQ